MRFLFHDYETTGLNKDFDQIIQFAGVQTDDELNIIGEPHNLLCKPRNDIIPGVAATLTHGISIRHAAKHGLSEIDFARKINAIMSGDGNQCSLGYNTLSFDDEFSRRLFYRNLIDAYSREWRNNNSRADVMPMMYTMYALRPETLEWALKDTGAPSFKLEDITRKNNIVHEHAHDALSDVYATISVAKIIKERNQKLFHHMLSLRNKYTIKDILDKSNLNKSPLLHVSPFYGFEGKYLSLIMPIIKHPTNANATIVCDLRKDVSALLDMSPEEIRSILFTKKEELPEHCPEIPIATIQGNKMPAIFDTSGLLTDAVANRSELDVDACMRNAEIIQKNERIKQIVQNVFSHKLEPHADIDAQIYSGGFLSNEDRRLLDSLQGKPIKEWRSLGEKASDKRLPEMIYRVIARNYPEELTNEEKSKWDSYRTWRLTNPESDCGRTIHDLREEISGIRIERILTMQEELLIEELESYAKSITRTDANIPERRTSAQGDGNEFIF